MYCKRNANVFAAMNVIRVHLFVRTFTKEILFEPLDNLWLVLKSMFALAKLHHIGARVDKTPKNSLISIYTVRVGVHNKFFYPGTRDRPFTEVGKSTTSCRVRRR